MKDLLTFLLLGQMLEDIENELARNQINRNKDRITVELGVTPLTNFSPDILGKMQKGLIDGLARTKSSEERKLYNDELLRVNKRLAEIEAIRTERKSPKYTIGKMIKRITSEVGKPNPLETTTYDPFVSTMPDGRFMVRIPMPQSNSDWSIKVFDWVKHFVKTYPDSYIHFTNRLDSVHLNIVITPGSIDQHLGR